MKPIKRNSLDINVQALNEVNKYALKVINEILPQMSNLIGQKILLSDGKKSKKWTIETPKGHKFKDEISDCFVDSNCYFDITTHSVYLMVKTCINGGSYDTNTAYCVYVDKFYYLGSIKDGILVEVCSLDKSPLLSYNVGEQTSVEKMSKLISEYKETKVKADSLKRLIPESIFKSQYLH
jgi:hypothetical protein